MSKNIRKNVEQILQDYPQTRNSDRLLYVTYWKVIDDLPIDHETSARKFANLFIKNSTNSESIRRARQLIQQEGLFLPTDDSVIKARHKKQITMKDAILNDREVV